MEEVLKNQQKIIFSGAGTLHQNEVAEGAIKTVVTMARMMLIRSDLRFPDNTLYTNLWPMVMYYVVCIYNQIPDMQSVLSDIKYG